jgi:hypothetical protein
MLFPDSYRWTLKQRWFIAGVVAAVLVALSVLVYSYERYYRGPDDSVFAGTWRGEADYTGETRIGYHFKPDHTYEGEWEPGGRWYAGGEFLYLRQHFDGPWVSVPYNTLQLWHIDSMTQTELRMHEVDWGLHAVLKRVE